MLGRVGKETAVEKRGWRLLFGRVKAEAKAIASTQGFLPLSALRRLDAHPRLPLISCPALPAHLLLSLSPQERFEEKYAAGVAPRVAEEAALSRFQADEARRRHVEASAKHSGDALEQHCAVSGGGWAALLPSAWLLAQSLVLPASPITLALLIACSPLFGHLFTSIPS